MSDGSQQSSAYEPIVRSYSTAVDLSRKRLLIANFVGGLIVVADDAADQGLWGCIFTVAPGSALPSGEVRAVGIAQSGIVPIICGAACAAGIEITTDSQGRAVPAVANDFTIGESKTETTTAGEWVSVLLRIPAIRKEA